MARSILKTIATLFPELIGLEANGEEIRDKGRYIQFAVGVTRTDNTIGKEVVYVLKECLNNDRIS